MSENSGNTMPEVEKPKIGRPTDYTPELASELCARLAEGKSLRTVCLPENMPSKTTVFNWMRTQPDFLDQYTRAKQEATDALADEVQDIADDGRNDWMEIHKNGQDIVLLDREHVERSKLRIETRKWLMAKMKPKKYGDKLDLTSDGEKLPPNSITFVPFNADRK